MSTGAVEKDQLLPLHSTSSPGVAHRQESQSSSSGWRSLRKSVALCGPVDLRANRGGALSLLRPLGQPKARRLITLALFGVVCYTSMIALQGVIGPEAYGLRGADRTAHGFGGRRNKLPEKHTVSLAPPVDWVDGQRAGAFRPSEVVKLGGSGGHRGDARGLVSKGSMAAEAVNEERRQSVRRAFLHAWSGYKKYAWGHDEILPTSKMPADPFFGWGASIIDALDTLYLMDLKKEFAEARAFVSRLEWRAEDADVLVFESIIRYVAGLLSAYELSGDTMFLVKARALSDKLLPAFNTSTGLPSHRVNINTGERKNPTWGHHASMLAEVGSCQLEFTKLSRLTGDTKYESAAQSVINFLDDMQTSVKGLYPSWIDPESGQALGDESSFAAYSDSFYEYLLKRYLLTDKKDEQYLRMYMQSADALQSHLVSRSASDPSLYFVGELRYKNHHAQMDHLACFTGGLLALGSMSLDGRRAEDQKLGARLTESCYRTYERSENGLAPETWTWEKFPGGLDGLSRKHSARLEDRGFLPASKGWNLRPETVESLFVLYRATGDEKYRDWGWKIFENVLKRCRTDVAFSGVNSEGEHTDKMESFFLAETLKYAYLLFSPMDILPLSDWVFNTEGHPLRIHR